MIKLIYLTYLCVCDQVRLLKSQLDQRQKIGSDGVQDPKGDGLENGMDSHLLDLQSTSSSSILLSLCPLTSL